jgi:hypothetical protein
MIWEACQLKGFQCLITWLLKDLALWSMIARRVVSGMFGFNGWKVSHIEDCYGVCRICFQGCQGCWDYFNWSTWERLSMLRYTEESPGTYINTLHSATLSCCVIVKFGICGGLCLCDKNTCAISLPGCYIQFLEFLSIAFNFVEWRWLWNLICE